MSAELTFGVLPGGGTPEEFLTSVQTAEALGFDSAWMGDHVLWHVFWPDPIPMLSAGAAVTTEIGLGTGVLLAALRRPAALAKQTATLQWLSGGRFRLGVGTGGEFASEFEASGVPLSQRGRYLDATLEALQALWTGERVSLHSAVIDVEDARLDLVPEPRIPIWVGGRAEAAQRRAARFGDARMPFVVTPDVFAAGWAHVREEAERLGRDPALIRPAVQLWAQFDDDLAEALTTIAARIEATYRTPFERFERYTVYGDASMWTERLGTYVEAGVRHFNLVFAGGAGWASWRALRPRWSRPCRRRLATLVPAKRRPAARVRSLRQQLATYERCPTIRHRDRAFWRLLAGRRRSWRHAARDRLLGQHAARARRRLRFAGRAYHGAGARRAREGAGLMASMNGAQFVARTLEAYASRTSSSCRPCSPWRWRRWSASASSRSWRTPRRRPRRWRTATLERSAAPGSASASPSARPTSRRACRTPSSTCHR